MNTAMLLTPKALVTCIYSDVTAAEGLEQFIKGGYTAVPVIDRDGIYVGVVSERDFLYHMLDIRSTDIGNEELTVGDLVSVERFESVQIDADIEEIFERIIAQNFVPVVDSRGMFSGIVTRKAVIVQLRKRAAKQN